MSSPCLGTVERTCSGFELGILKAPSPSSSSSARSSCSSECSSSVVISTKRARTSRKRPNQAYAEAAILLSTVYPNVFNTENLPKLCKAHTNPFFATSPPPPPPPPFPADYLIEDDPDPSPSPGGRTPLCRFEFKSVSRPMASAGVEFQDPGLPDYDVESILDEEEVGEEGIDSIMGKLSTEKPESSSLLNPFLGGLMGLGIGGRFGLLLGQNNNIRQAMRGARSGEWWSESTMVEVKDIVPKFDVLPHLATTKKKKSSKKKKNKVGKEESKGDVQAISDPTTADAAAATSSSSEAKLKPAGLGLKLNYDNIVEAWSDRQFPFTKETGTPEFSADALARLTEVDLTPDTEGGGAREASVQRFREKRRTRLFSKKIRYQVRKVNADCRPRMKASGRFVRRPSPLQDTEEGSQ